VVGLLQLVLEVGPRVCAPVDSCGVEGGAVLQSGKTLCLEFQMLLDVQHAAHRHGPLLYTVCCVALQVGMSRLRSRWWPRW
jgi:hypothetical protein